MERNYYLVEAKCGHVGRNFYIKKTYPVMAETSHEAAIRVRHMPRVKHHDKYAILSMSKVDKAAFDIAVEEFRNDPYFKCTNIQDQRCACEDIYDSRISGQDDDDEMQLKQRNKKKEFNKKHFIRDILDDLYDYENDEEFNYAFA